MSNNQDRTKFSFAQEEGGFDNHIEKSIQGYNNLYDMIVRMSEYYVSENSSVLDIGCSTGRMLRDIFERNKDTDFVDYLGVEYEKAFKEEIEANIGPINQNIRTCAEVSLNDIRESSPLDDDEDDYPCSFVTSIFTLQFIPDKDRLSILEQVVENMDPRGAFIIAEKVVCEDPRLQEMMTFLYYDHKQKNFTGNEILAKEQKLRKMLRPSRESDLQAILHQAGFEVVQCFWRNYNFVAYICLDPKPRNNTES